MILIRDVFLSIAVLLSLSVFAQEQMTFSSELNKTRYQSLVEELRCPKCQNQNLADSGSGIAVDLRELVHQMIEQGKTDQEIVDYMVARYGSFVLYRPQHSTATFLLWYGPFILLGIGLLAFVVVVMANRKRRGRDL
ncbi:MAG: cytochrome c-type biogenesis protein CcmH [Gammaproteobacteria bacterium]|uniref:cytochrome c-type biogenesis protein n=1 Tax=Marinomonas sp. BSi20584 TaxID=1594462 RepID=UPI000C1E750E|nr:cytochrome c-type biogenesis protein [Marinomonas sp. BSi20584]MBU1295246.1 cytochrome c-type biogenesis protein CcmH [Gammaproteobacteria bacterium]MBU1466686.1 cytochrome c-type biogenesis protein CcmH [Gammaproteobacteria bacterium]MBU2021673.1 cytochrome c-type biogenesis protein CcmH [Gammaproteobacteria bacterium]MBU2237995.1 cytochrome c-type biogenesis protein CcmH [Gammaproteobacteria bacterium]MBU2320559.1 cytochrome c-type biogenesis protein CcmH [Gammaproteobacteria bacterium]